MVWVRHGAQTDYGRCPCKSWSRHCLCQIEPGVSYDIALSSHNENSQTDFLRNRLPQSFTASSSSGLKFDPGPVSASRSGGRDTVKMSIPESDCGLWQRRRGLFAAFLTRVTGRGERAHGFECLILGSVVSTAKLGQSSRDRNLRLAQPELGHSNKVDWASSGRPGRRTIQHVHQSLIIVTGAFSWGWES